MLDETFQHLPGIGPRGERNLWKAGIRTWSDFLTVRDAPGISTERKLILDTRLRADLVAFENRRWTRFHDWPLPLHHRALPHLDRIVYLDIETYGVKDHRVSIIAVSDGEHARVMNGAAIDRSVIEPIIDGAEAIVTFNGSRFDIPYLARAYRLETRAFHIDLEPLARRAGYTGGLKAIEHELGIERETSLGSGEPLALWKSYLATGDEHFLAILTSYVEQDVLSLPVLLEALT